MKPGLWRVAGGKPVEVPEAPQSKGQAVRIDVRPGGWLVVDLGDRGRVRLALTRHAKMLSSQLSGYCWQGEYQSARDLADEGFASKGSGAQSGSAAEVGVAQFPGKVRKILAVVGVLLQEGDPIVLVEAMKMEFAIKAPGPGRVKKILVTEGQQLQPGDQFVEWEAHVV